MIKSTNFKSMGRASIEVIAADEIDRMLLDEEPVKVPKSNIKQKSKLLKANSAADNEIGSKMVSFSTKEIADLAVKFTTPCLGTIEFAEVGTKETGAIS